MSRALPKNDFPFYERLWDFYLDNKRLIRKSYKEASKRYLDFNDKDKNPNAYLREPQFHALEMYVLIKEFFDNAQVYQIFSEWYNGTGKFAQLKYDSSIKKEQQISLFDFETKKEYKEIFDYYQLFSEGYPNYIYALTMGLGKTILMATCIFYDFILASKFPKDNRFIHNVVVFAPDKTVRQSLKEIPSFDKSKVVPKEYLPFIDSNVKFHMLEEGKSGTVTTLNTIDGSDFNIIITNSQKIILKKRSKERAGIDKLMNDAIPDEIKGVLSDVYSEEAYRAALPENDDDLISNQRFEKLCRLRQLGVFVDEAHHLFGAELQENLLKTDESKTSLRNTINYLHSELQKNGTNLVACYNYSGTPYVKNSILPDVVSAYGLKEAIDHEYLKKASILSFDKVTGETFVNQVLTDFFNKHQEEEYEGLKAKIAFFAPKIDQLHNELEPLVKKVLRKLGKSEDLILVNVGDEKLTKESDINNFNNLDVQGTEGSNKQILLLVNKGREGWNCRSLFSVAMYRSPSSQIFVLQATMRCLRQISDIQQTATIYLSQENADILEEQLKDNMRLNIKAINVSGGKPKFLVEVRVNEPLIKLKIPNISHNYGIKSLNPTKPINFHFDKFNEEKYKSYIYKKQSITDNRVAKREEIVEVSNREMSLMDIVFEVSRYFNISPLKIENIISNCVDGVEKVVSMVSKYNTLVVEKIVICIFKYLYQGTCETEYTEEEVFLLKKPEGIDHYSFKAEKDLIADETDILYKKVKSLSFHADNYCFDSKPEKQFFDEYLLSHSERKIKKLYFTGMFTSSSSGLSVQYIDPETNAIRNYYPDFIVEYEDGTREFIEVKGDNMIDDKVVQAKAEAAREFARALKVKYRMISSSTIMKGQNY